MDLFTCMILYVSHYMFVTLIKYNLWLSFIRVFLDFTKKKVGCRKTFLILSQEPIYQLLTQASFFPNAQFYGKQTT